MHNSDLHGDERARPGRGGSIGVGSSSDPARVGAEPAARPSAPRRLLRRLAGERGAATAEYAVATMAAVGFAGLLVVILRGDEVRGILTDLVRNALTVG